MDAPCTLLFTDLFSNGQFFKRYYYGRTYENTPACTKFDFILTTIAPDNYSSGLPRSTMDEIFSIPPIKKGSSKNALFKKRSSEKVCLKKRSTAILTHCSWSLFQKYDFTWSIFETRPSTWSFFLWWDRCGIYWWLFFFRKVICFGNTDTFKYAGPYGWLAYFSGIANTNF